jgi:hypothetical protein
MPSNCTAALHVSDMAARTLACAVIKQALADALDPTVAPDIRKDAETFLTGDDWYRVWCNAGGFKATPLLSRHVA